MKYFKSKRLRRILALVSDKSFLLIVKISKNMRNLSRNILEIKI